MAKVKKKLNLKRISIFLICLLLIILLIVKLPKKIKLKEKEDITEAAPIKKETSLTLAMVGDALINDNLYNDAKKDNSYDFKPYLKLIKEKITKYDLAYYNQETILGGSSIGLSSYPAFNSPQEVGDAMIDARFDIVS